MTSGPLGNVRVADFTWQIAGPTCTRYLGLMGAEVLRVESSRRPDPYRQRTISHLINQNKKSITLNLSHPRAIELAKEVASLSDVVIENFAPGVIERLGLGYEELRRENPDIIMVSSAGLGHTGPDFNQVAYGTLVQCFTGWSALQGYPAGDESSTLLPGPHGGMGRRSQYGGPEIGGIWTDPMVGMLEVFLVNAALNRRWEHGEGQYIDLSMAEATTMLLPETVLEYGMNGRVQEPVGNGHESAAPHGNYPCLGDDQWVGIVVETDEQWQALCETLEHSEWVADPRFETGLLRWRNREALDKLLAAVTAGYDAAELAEALQRAGTPAAPSLSVGQLWGNPHLRERGFFHGFRDHDGTEYEFPGAPWRFDGELEGEMAAQPLRGEHNGYVFRELLGLPDAGIERLVEEQVIY